MLLTSKLSCGMIESHEKGGIILKRKIHEPYQKFKGVLKEKEITYRDIGNILGITETSVSHKINGYSDFFISEVEKIKNKYGIPEKIFCP